MGATAGSTGVRTQEARTACGSHTASDSRNLRKIFCADALARRASISYLLPCSEHGARLGRNLDRAVLRRGGNPEAEGRLDEVDESATGSLNFWAKVLRTLAHFFGRAMPDWRWRSGESAVSPPRTGSLPSKEGFEAS